LRFRPAKLTSAKVRKFEAHIKNSYEGVIFELMVTHNLLVRKVVELTRIIVQDRKKGVGTAIMRELCEFADRHSAEISLKTASKGDYAATTSRARLIRFYKRFGFVEDKANHIEFTALRGMSRKPHVLPSSLTQVAATA
jgi:GNAT superfamily N-acetyltransferase